MNSWCFAEIITEKTSIILSIKLHNLYLHKSIPWYFCLYTHSTYITIYKTDNE